MGSRTFLYFAYGSNLLKERLRLHNPTAVYVCVARLEDFFFHYCGFGNRWQGGMGAIHKQPGSRVWGVVWQLDESDKEHLDHQERWYTPIDVDVISMENKVYHCRTYFLEPMELNPPSPHYKDVIMTGAKQHNLPAEYIKYLESFQDNGYKGEIRTYNQVMEELRKSKQQQDS